MEIKFAGRMDDFQPGIFNVLDDRKNERLAQGKPVRGRLAQDRPVQGRLAQDKPVWERLAQDKPVQGRLVQDRREGLRREREDNVWEIR